MSDIVFPNTSFDTEHVGQIGPLARVGARRSLYYILAGCPASLGRKGGKEGGKEGEGREGREGRDGR